MKQARCQKCKWYKERDAEEGLCILNPPTPVSVVEGSNSEISTSIEFVLPIVPKDWHCGKFDAK